jgi:hypothetical protein
MSKLSQPELVDNQQLEIKQNPQGAISTGTTQLGSASAAGGTTTQGTRPDTSQGVERPKDEVPGDNLPE